MDAIRSGWSTDFESMTIDELWELHERIAAALAAKIRSEQQRLDTQLSQLFRSVPTASSKAGRRDRRPYPKVEPKYRSI